MVEIWKELKCPSRGLNKIQYIHAVEYYAAIKKKEVNLYIWAQKISLIIIK